MSRATGCSVGSVYDLWQADEIKPHLARNFKVTEDKECERKFWDVISPYSDPPDTALVLCCDEDSQSEAL